MLSKDKRISRPHGAHAVGWPVSTHVAPSGVCVCVSVCRAQHPKRMNRLRCFFGNRGRAKLYGPKERRIGWECALAPPGKYCWTSRARPQLVMWPYVKLLWLVVNFSGAWSNRLALISVGSEIYFWSKYLICRFNVMLKVKVAHTRLPSAGFRCWSRFLAVSVQVPWVINPAVGCHYFPPGLQLPSQPLRGLVPISLLGEQRHDGCEQFA